VAHWSEGYFWFCLNYYRFIGHNLTLVEGQTWNAIPASKDLGSCTRKKREIAVGEIYGAKGRGQIGGGEKNREKRRTRSRESHVTKRAMEKKKYSHLAACEGLKVKGQASRGKKYSRLTRGRKGGKERIKRRNSSTATLAWSSDDERFGRNYLRKLTSQRGGHGRKKIGREGKGSGRRKTSCSQRRGRTRISCSGQRKVPVTQPVKGGLSQKRVGVEHGKRSVKNGVFG